MEAKAVALATGTADVPRRLQIPGEDLDFVTHRPPIHNQVPGCTIWIHVDPWGSMGTMALLSHMVSHMASLLFAESHEVSKMWNKQKLQ